VWCDEVWSGPLMQSWAVAPNRQVRMHAPFTKEMQDEVEWFYFRQYCCAFSAPILKHLMATVPQVRTAVLVHVAALLAAAVSGSAAASDSHSAILHTCNMQRGLSTS
jgi:hypothetical protein